MLRVKGGPLAGRQIDVDSEITLGRESADIDLTDSEASRRHAALRPVDGGLEIEDLGSLNGTRVNGQKITAPTRLKAGDVLKIGQTIIEVESVGSAGGRTVASAPETQLAARRPQTAPAKPAAPQPLPPLPPQPIARSTSRGGLVKVIALVVILILVAGVIYLVARPKGLSRTALVAKVSPSVVEITGKVRNETVGGTGIVIDADRGFVLTNAHVVAGVAAITVRLNSGQEVSGRVVGRTSCDDLAVISLNPKPAGLTALKFAEGSVKVGQDVSAFGFPASFQNPSSEKLTFTNGSVSVAETSAVNFSPDLPNYSSVVEHTAPINPGNSGGPLVNDRGDLVGVNSLGNTQLGGRIIQGQYYAISVSHVKELLPDLERGRSSTYVGWSLIANTADVRDAIRSVLDLDLPTDHGVFVDAVDAGTPAEAGHIAFADVILQIGGADVNTVQDVCDILKSSSPGQTLRVDEFGLNREGNYAQFTERVKLSS